MDAKLILSVLSQEEIYSFDNNFSFINNLETSHINIDKSVMNRNTSSGIKFEKIVSCEDFLLKRNFIKTSDYLYCKDDNIEIYYFSQGIKFKKFVKKIYKLELFTVPDEIFIVKNQKNETKIRLIEVKNQNVSGSVDLKFLAGQAIKNLIQEEFDSLNIKIDYAFSVNSFLESNFKNINNKRFQKMKRYNENCNIPIFYAENNPSYFQDLYEWVLS